MTMLTAVVADGRLRAGDPAATPAPWWSLTKTVLAAASLALVAAGRLALDDPCRFGPFTLRQLLRHTAGVPEYGALADYHAAVARNDAPWSDAELLERVHAEQLLFAPDHGWAYSNVGYLYVRRLIEEAAGDEMEAAVRRLVLRPLALSSVRLAREPADLVSTAWANAQGYHPGWVYHGLLVGTPADAALFVDRLFRGTLLPAALREAMGEMHLILDMPPSSRPWQRPAYGLGVMIDADSPHGRVVGHTGGGPGSVAAAYHFADRTPPVTTAAFADVDDPAVVERAVIALAT